MNSDWHDELPIYKQLIIKLKTAILDNSFAEGESLPSVRAVSADLSINHITVSKAYHELVDERLIEKKRGVGMFVVQGAVKKLMEEEKTVFIDYELPKLVSRIKQLGITPQQVLDMMASLTKEQEK